MVEQSSFLAAVNAIYRESPSYRLGGDGSDGTCDCIGLIIGAIRRCGGTWTGTHGSNYAARYAMRALRQVTSAAALGVGEIVYKAHEPGDAGYALPSTYRNDSDQRDYYHVGVVMGVSPLKIMHCTSPTVKIDTKLGKWAYAGRLKVVEQDGKGVDDMDALYMATVNTQQGPLNVRDAPKTGKVIGQIPKGAAVEVLSEGEWERVRYGALEGYSSAQYLKRIDGGSGNTQDASKAVVTIVDGEGNTFTPAGSFTVQVNAAGMEK